MKTTRFLSCSAAIFAALISGLPTQARDDSLVTAVFSNARRDYVRAKNSDGSFKRETYVVGNGGYNPGVAADPSIDRVSFPDLIRVMAGYLAKESYVPAPAGQTADLLLVLAWGTTMPFDDSTYRLGLYNMAMSTNRLKLANYDLQNTPHARDRSFEGIQSPLAAVQNAAQEEFVNDMITMRMFDDMRSKSDEQNARLLGYVSEVNRTNDLLRFAGAGSYYDDLISDLENERYYVIVSAYDYRLAQEKKPKLLWTTRVSIQAQGNHFDRSVAAMLASASHHFGQNTDRLIRQYHEGVVGIGEFKVVGIAPDPSSKEQPADKK